MGGSLLTNGNVLNVMNHVVERERPYGGKLIIVVSAMKGVTDLLIRASDNHDPKALDDAILMYVNEALNLGLNKLASFLELTREELRRFINLEDPWIRDYVVIHGELLSVLLVENVLRDLLELNARAVYEPGIMTNDSWGSALVNHELSSRYVVNRFRKLLSAYDVAIVPGFLGVTEDGRYTSLGRGGSDYTASLLANYLGASRLTFYTDSGGLLSGDPRIINDPVLIKEISYGEANVASMLGAKKFHPRTFEPLMNSRVVTFITDPWHESGTYVINNCITAPKLVTVSETGRDGFRVSVVGCNLSLNERLRSEVTKIVSSYEINEVRNEHNHAISTLVNDWDDAIALARDVHRWVRVWIA
nr:aspartate kinase [Vulcanisaeta souniana]